MKKLFVLLLSVLSLTAVAQTQTIALLEPRAGEGSVSLTPMEKAMVRGELRKAIVNMPGYQAITRADIDQMMKEQNFQRTGMVSDEQIKQMGEMSGADYICVSTLTKSNTEFYIETYLIHLESGRMSNPASQYGELTNGKFANMLPVCERLAKELLGATSQRTVQPTYSVPQATQTQPQVQKIDIDEALTTDKDKLFLLSDGTIVHLLWNDPSYSADCRSAGKKAFVFDGDMYKQVYKEAKKSGLKTKEAYTKAMEEVIRVGAEAANKVVLECSKGK